VSEEIRICFEYLQDQISAIAHNEVMTGDAPINQPVACIEAFSHLADKARNWIDTVIGWIEEETPETRLEE